MLALDAIRKIAGEQPGLVAVIHDGVEITYLVFWNDIVRAAGGISGKLGPGKAAVGVAMRDDYAQFVAVLAVQSLGYSPVLFNTLARPLASGDAVPDMRGAQRIGQLRLARIRQMCEAGAIACVVTDGYGQAASLSSAACRYVKLSIRPGEVAADGGDEASSRADPGADPLAGFHALAPDARLHVDVAFGARGVPRFIPRSRMQFEHWVDAFSRAIPKTRRARYLVVHDALHGERFARVMSAWARADQVIFERRLGMAEAVSLHHPDEFSVTASALQRLLRLLPAHCQLGNQPQVEVLGGALSVRLQREAIRRLRCELIGSWVAPGSGAFAHAFGVDPGDEWCDRFRLVDWARVEIVDESGEVLPENHEGWVRLLAQHLPDRCWGPEGRRRVLRDGWLYTGDRGALLPERVLQIVAHAGLVSHLDGVRLYHPTIEEALLQIPGVLDAAVFVASSADGGNGGKGGEGGEGGEDLQRLHAAVVPIRGMRSLVRQRLNVWLADQGSHLRRPRILLVGFIPRGSSGMVQRGELLASVAANSGSSLSVEEVN